MIYLLAERCVNTQFINLLDLFFFDFTLVAQIGEDDKQLIAVDDVVQRTIVKVNQVVGFIFSDDLSEHKL